MENKMERINALLEKPCFIMDYLPEQVKADNGGQFFDVEYYLLNSDKHIGLKDGFVAVILKLMCYYHVAILWNGWVNRPSPGMIEEAVCEIMENHSGTLNVLFVEADALLVFDWDCLNLSVYNPTENVQSIMMERIAFSEGLFWRTASVDEIPYWETVNKYLEKLEPEELQDIVCQLVYRLVRSRAFANARIRNKYWQVIVDGTQIHSSAVNWMKQQAGILTKPNGKHILLLTVHAFADVMKCMYKIRGAGCYGGGKNMATVFDVIKYILHKCGEMKCQS